MTGEDYKQQYLNFIRNEKRRSNIMTMARVQPRLRKLDIDLGYYNAESVFSRTVTNRESALYFYTLIIFVYYGNLRMLVSIKL